MRLRRIVLHHFKIFEDAEYNFEEINYISGENGAGKTTLGREAYEFVIYGYTPKDTVLADFLTHGKDSPFYGIVEVEYQGHIYTIKRSYPTKVEVRIDNGKPEKEPVSILTSIFGTRATFVQFRIIDAYADESNFLKQGPVTLKNILFKASDELFNTARINLNTIKMEREKYNKDEAVIYKHYPSEKRLETIMKSLEYYQTQAQKLEEDLQGDEVMLQEIKTLYEKAKANKEYNEQQITTIDNYICPSANKIIQLEAEIIKNNTRILNYENQLKDLNTQTETVQQSNKCYVCKRPLEEKTQQDILTERKLTADKVQDSIKELKKIIVLTQADIIKFQDEVKKEKARKLEDLKTEIEILDQDIKGYEESILKLIESVIVYKDQQKRWLVEKDKLNHLKIVLETRLKQRQYIYTTKDVLVVKKAIEELDRISSVYLVDTVKNLEPIINSVLEKINFTVQFDVDTKGKFAINLTQNGYQFKKNSLSTGQSLMLQIAFKLALLLQKNEDGLIIADEGLVALDDKNLGHIIDMFQGLPFQLILTGHRIANLPETVNKINVDKE